MDGGVLCQDGGSTYFVQLRKRGKSKFSCYVGSLKFYLNSTLDFPCEFSLACSSVLGLSLLLSLLREGARAGEDQDPITQTPSLQSVLKTRRLNPKGNGVHWTGSI